MCVECDSRTVCGVWSVIVLHWGVRLSGRWAWHSYTAVRNLHTLNKTPFVEHSQRWLANHIQTLCVEIGYNTTDMIYYYHLLSLSMVLWRLASPLNPKKPYPSSYQRPLRLAPPLLPSQTPTCLARRVTLVIIII